MILLDGFYYLHCCGYALADLVTRTGKPTGMEFGFLKGIEALKRFFKDDLIVCWEGKNNFRYKIDPEYKVNRNKHAKLLKYDRVAEFKELLSMVVATAEMEGLEGDDVIASLAGRWDKTIIYSSDKDLLQLVSKDPKIVQVPTFQCRKDPRTVKWIAKKYFGLRPDQLLTFFAFTGDKVDNIPGAKRVQKAKIAAAIRNGYKPENLSDFELFSTYELFILEEHYNSGRFQKNIELITLRKESNIQVTERDWQPEKIGEWLEMMEFRTLKLCEQCGVKVTIREDEEF